MNKVDLLNSIPDESKNLRDLLMYAGAMGFQLKSIGGPDASGESWADFHIWPCANVPEFCKYLYESQQKYMVDNDVITVWFEETLQPLPQSLDASIKNVWQYAVDYSRKKCHLYNEIAVGEHCIYLITESTVGRRCTTIYPEGGDGR